MQTQRKLTTHIHTHTKTHTHRDGDRDSKPRGETAAVTVAPQAIIGCVSA